MPTLKPVEDSKIHRLFYPQVPVIVTVEFESRVGGIPAIWYMPLSFNPPLVGVAISPEHETFKMIIAAKAFGINWLDFKYGEEIAKLGEISAKSCGNKLALVGLTTLRGHETSQPLIRQASAHLECRLTTTQPTGTHQLVIGKVLSAWAMDSFNEYWDFARYDPILYAGTKSLNGKCWMFISTRGESIAVPFTTDGKS